MFVGDAWTEDLGHARLHHKAQRHPRVAPCLSRRLQHRLPRIPPCGGELCEIPRDRNFYRLNHRMVANLADAGQVLQPEPNISTKKFAVPRCKDFVKNIFIKNLGHEQTAP